MDGADGNYLEYDRQQRHFAKDDGGTASVTKALPLNGGFSDTVSHGRERWPLPPAFVILSLAMPKKTTRETRCDRLGLASDRASGALRCLAVEVAMACRPHEFERRRVSQTNQGALRRRGWRKMAAAAAFLR